MVTEEQKEKCISAIIKMQIEINEDTFKGYKPCEDDMFQSYRDQIQRLRAVLFDSQFIRFCDTNKLHPLDDGSAYVEYLHAKNLMEDEIDKENGDWKK
jgi:hypothetical protein